MSSTNRAIGEGTQTLARTLFAICLKARRNRVDGVLMLLEDRDAAEEIAFELRARDVDVEVREYASPDSP
jgi:hypothetical protein